MRYQVIKYLAACLRYSIRPSWESAIGFSGTLIAFYFTGLAERISSAFLLLKGHQTTEKLFITLLVVAMSYSVTFLFRVLFVAPFRLYQQAFQSQNEAIRESNEARDRLNGLIHGDSPDLPFAEAIAVTRQLMRANVLDISEQKAAEEIVTKLFYGKLKAWGEPPRFLSLLPRARTKVAIPAEFFFDPNWAPTESDGYYFEIYNSLPYWDDHHKHRMYYNVTLNRDQIFAIFA